MLNLLSWNFNREATDVRLFEMGNVFWMSSDRVAQRKAACFTATGSAGERGVELRRRSTDFFDLKGDAEAILESFEKRSLEFMAPASGYFHPGRSAKVVLSGETIGELGQLHPDLAAERKFKQEVWIAELDLDRLFAAPLREPRYRRLSRYPSVERDFSLLVDTSVSYERLRKAIESLHIAELETIEPRELFRGAGVPQGKYSLLLHLVFQSSERTLRDEEVSGWSQQVIAAVEGLGGSLRG